MYHMGWWCLAFGSASIVFSPVKLEVKMAKSTSLSLDLIYSSQPPSNVLVSW